MRHPYHFVRLGAAALCIAGAGSVLAGGEPSDGVATVKATAARQQLRGKPTSGVVVARLAWPAARLDPSAAW